MAQLGGLTAAAAAAAAAAGGPPVREVAESCLELLCMQLAVGWKVGGPDLAARRAEAIGFQVGSQLAERYTKDRLRFVDHLEVIKFLCKEFWAEVFKKQIDNLKTNHRQAASAAAAAAAAAPLLFFPCGIVRGALTALGVPCTVSAQVSQLPACEFTVKLKA
eukprot:jgi/Chlat1/530/Chrsp103S00998